MLTARFCGTRRDARTVLFAYTLSFMPLNFSLVYSYVANGTGQTDERNVILLNEQVLCIKDILMNLDIFGLQFKDSAAKNSFFFLLRRIFYFRCGSECVITQDI